LYARGLEQSWAGFARPERPRFALQRTLPRPFRAQFLREADLAEYDGVDPRDVRPELRSARWVRMCEALDAWPELTSDQQCRLVRLLHALCFYQVIVERVPERSDAAGLSREDGTELAYWRASARYVLGLPDRVADYGHADLTAFERIVAGAPPRQPAAFDAAVKLLAHHAKVGAGTEELLKWRALVERRLEAVVEKTDPFTRTLLLSRFHRASAFVPHSAGDREEVVRAMDLAEGYARAAVPSSDAQELLYLENLHPIMESRAKEALWLGDLDLALARAREVIDLDTFDSRAWLELGQMRVRREEWALAAEAYATAAALGPPSRAIGCHMAGLCFRKLAQPLLAAFFFQRAVEIDPRATSPREEIQTLPAVPVLTPLKEWSLDSFTL
jgi:tetratricopeptide (TPR) repeat protein